MRQENGGAGNHDQRDHPNCASIWHVGHPPVGCSDEDLQLRLRMTTLCGGEEQLQQKLLLASSTMRMALDMFLKMCLNPNDSPRGFRTNGGVHVRREKKISHKQALFVPLCG
jgi:hypothetical protein